MHPAFQHNMHKVMMRERNWMGNLTLGLGGISSATEGSIVSLSLQRCSRGRNVRVKLGGGNLARIFYSSREKEEKGGGEEGGGVELTLNRRWFRSPFLRSVREVRSGVWRLRNEERAEVVRAHSLSPVAFLGPSIQAQLNLQIKNSPWFYLRETKAHASILRVFLFPFSFARMANKAIENLFRAYSTIENFVWIEQQQFNNTNQASLW
jgi:hypothetical protein